MLSGKGTDTYSSGAVFVFTPTNVLICKYSYATMISVCRLHMESLLNEQTEPYKRNWFPVALLPATVFSTWPLRISLLLTNTWRKLPARLVWSFVSNCTGWKMSSGLPRPQRIVRRCLICLGCSWDLSVRTCLVRVCSELI
jgi:hypothetical protein